MTKQEQIEQMIKIFTDNREVCHHMRCVECKYHGDEECMYSSYAYSLYQAGYGYVSEYKNRFEVANKVLTETREKLTKAEHDRDRYKAEIERLKADLDHQIDATNDAENLASHLKYYLDKVRKQAKIDILNKAKEKLDSAPNGWAYTGYIDDLIEEVEK